MKTVKIAELKDHLSQHLRAVEAGSEVVVTDRSRPIARIVPVSSATARVEIIPPRRDFAEIRDLPRPRVNLGVSSTALLLEERRERERLRR
ncbi:MAG TPA: type II toxin-antitoxin system prevent-host-death family antitoxin [Candidatus Limnocylindrales bacterium]|nr:type II toxin-antitoxin system prevent-host-death family antitoxin [Candidatus Limnocylindrales bacterium]